jgi:hypothetical protein
LANVEGLNLSHLALYLAVALQILGHYLASSLRLAMEIVAKM